MSYDASASSSYPIFKIQTSQVLCADHNTGIQIKIPWQSRNMIHEWIFLLSVSVLSSSHPHDLRWHWTSFRLFYMYLFHFIYCTTSFSILEYIQSSTVYPYFQNLAQAYLGNQDLVGYDTLESSWWYDSIQFIDQTGAFPKLRIEVRCHPGRVANKHPQWDSPSRLLGWRIDKHSTIGKGW